ncbi:MAG: heavy-metal-associated domain-containing protein [Rhizobiaceae bacterium]
MQTNLKIEGMHCDGCARAVRNVLSRVEGVTSVSVDLERGQADIQSDRPVTLEILRAAVEDAGYQARGVTGE